MFSGVVFASLNYSQSAVDSEDSCDVREEAFEESELAVGGEANREE